MKKFVAMVCALALAVGCVGGAAPAAEAAPLTGLTYYVSLSGKGGNDGLTEAKPLPGLDAVPWDELKSGDSVLLRKGDTFPGAIRLVDIHGTADAPITIGTYGTGDAPVIEARGQGIWLPETGNDNGATPGKYVSSGIALYDCSYVTVSGLTIVNVPDTMKTSFTYEDGTDYSSDKMVYSGIGVAADGVGTSEGITLEGITVRGNSELVAVKTDTSTTISTTGVTTGATATARTYTNASGTYYVSSKSGSDSNNGSTPDKAFYSLHKINELNLQPGAKVYLERGSVFENQYLHVNGGGADGNPIVIDAYGSGDAPVINTNGEGVWYQNYRKNLDNAGHLTHGYVSSSILLYDVPFIEVKNIAMTNFGRYGETPGADFANLGSYDGGTVPGETGYGGSAGGAGNKIGCYQWGGKMSRTGVAGVAQNMGTVTHTVLQNLDIENIYGNIVYKHMNNGGIYFTAARPLNTNTGIARFDDIVIEGCYLKRVSRWGIAAVHTAYWYELSPNGQQAIPDARCQQYGATNVYIGHNYLEEVGGDPITAMHAYEPFVEYNVAYNGGREMSSSATSNAVYINGTYFHGNSGDVSAGIWPWKCKTALFEHNECYTMLYSHLGGNNDAQPWDADSGDSTIYQYNYSSGNTGGCIMFCGGDAYNTVFRYNISYKDGKPWAESNPQNDGTRRGILDPSGSRNGQFTNNTFVMAEGTPVYHYTSGNRHTVRNNIFFNLGAEYAPEGGWTAASGLAFSKNIYVGFAQTGTGSYTTKDTDYTTLTKTDLFADPTFAGAPEAPKTTSKSGARMVNGVRDWTHDWASEFDMFKIADGNKANVANKGAAHDYDGLSQDSNFGVPRVENSTDFYGNALDGVHDIGAYDTQTADPVAPDEPDSDNELKASLFELRNTSELHVPFTANNPTTVEVFKKGLTVADTATVKVYSGSTEQADTAQIAADMTVKIVAEDGTESTAYTIKQKNTYNHQNDYVNQQQGNVWFHQVRGTDGELINLPTANGTAGAATGWWTGIGTACSEHQGAADDTTASGKQSDGCGFVFRAPTTGTVNITFPVQPKFRYGDRAYDNSFDTYVAVYRNGRLLDGKKVQVPKPATASETVTSANIAAFDLTVAQGDTIEFMVVNEGTFPSDHEANCADVLYNVAVSYKDEAVTEIPADTKAPTAPSALVVRSITDTTATVIWNASTDNVGVDHYEVSVNGGAAANVTELTKELTGLTENTEYTVTVKAVDAAGNQSGEASVTFRTAKAPDVTAPTAPTAPVTKATGPKTATISWTASTDNVGVTGYEVTVNGVTVEVRNITEVTLTGLSPATSYTASIVAFDEAGNRSQALSHSFRTAAADTTAPAAPGAVNAQRVTKSTADLIWSPSASEDVAGYQVKVDEGQPDDVGKRLRHTLTGLEGFTGYTAAVRAYDEAGNFSGWTSVSFQTTGSSEMELLSTLFEVRESNQLQVPYTEKNPMTLEHFRAAFTVSEDAAVKVYQSDGTTEVTSGSVEAGMVVKIVAQDGTVNPTSYTVAQKNGYNSNTDWLNNTQGNVWFYQYDNGTQFVNHTAWDSQWSCWGGASPKYQSVERNQACGSITTGEGSGFTFRAPADGNVQLRLFCYNGTTLLGEDQVRMRQQNNGNTLDHYIRIYLNGEELVDKAIELQNNTNMVNTRPMTIALAQGDTLSVMAWNGGDFSNVGGNSGIFFNPVLTYMDETYKPRPTSVSLNETTAALGIGDTLQLTATVLPAEADQTVAWESTNPDVATVDENGLVTAVGNGTTAIIASVDHGWGRPLTLTTSCAVTVSTKVTGITVKKDGTPVGDTPVKVYANEALADHPHSVTLTADVTPGTATNKMLSWTRPEGAKGMLEITRAPNGQSATLTATTNELNVGEVKVEVASESNPEVKQTITVHVIRALENDVYVTGEAKVGSTLTASTVDLVMKDAAKGMLKYQWYRGAISEENKIEGAIGKQYVVTENDIGATLSVTVTADPVSFYEGTRSAAAEQPVAKMDGPAAPEGLTAVQCTESSDGAITGLDSTKAYEYSTNGTDWTAVGANATEITLPAGTYLIRYAATDTQEASAAVTRTILPADATGYDITFDVAEGGSIDVDRNPATADERVTITVTPDTGYVLVEDSLSATYTDGEGASQTLEVTDNAFTMPAADVTISAQFKKQTFTITHDMENVTCSLSGEHTHTVEYGDQPVITLNADEGYTMPANVTVTVTGSDTLFHGYTYSHKAATPDTATLTFTQGITEDLTISGTAPTKTYAVNYTVKNGVTAPEENAPRSVRYGEAYTGTLVAAEGYRLPLGITVTMDGEPFADFTYDSTSGEITIAQGKITGNLVITASGVDASEPVIPVTGVELSQNHATLDKGKTLRLVAKVTPENATDSSVTWRSTDPAIATVNEEGVVTGVTVGSAIIIVTTVDGRRVATCTVTVREPSKPTAPVVTEPSDKTETVTNPDGSTTTTVTAPDGTVTETTVATDGAKVEKATDPEKNVAITVTDPEGEVVAEVKLPAVIAEPETRFEDVPEGHWADEGIHNMAALKAVNGVGNNQFDMNSGMTRGDLATILHRISNKPAGGDVNFADVDNDKYYAAGIAWAAKTGVVTGFSKDTYKPEQVITREQMALMLMRYAKLLGMDTAVSAAVLDPYSDSNSAHNWAIGAVAWCVQSGILQGTGNGKLAPTANVTRAQVAVMLDRFVALMK